MTITRCGGQGDLLAGSLATFLHWALNMSQPSASPLLAGDHHEDDAVAEDDDDGDDDQPALHCSALSLEHATLSQPLLHHF